MKFFTVITKLFGCVFLAGIFLATPVHAQGLSLFGSVSAEALTGLTGEDRGKNGFESELRIISETESSPNAFFRAEAGVFFTYGLASETAIALEANAFQQPQSLPPGDDLHREFFIDQAYAGTNQKYFSLYAGIIPVGWGSAYVYNPVSRTAPPQIPGEDFDRIIGRSGIKVFIPMPAGFSAEGYVAAEPRITNAVVDIAEVDSDTFPFGLKIQCRGTCADFALYALRELMTPGEEKYWYGADTTVIVRDATLYAEAATTSTLSPEISVGFSYTVPFLDAVLRSEYIYLDSGEDADSYNAAAFLDGSRTMLGRQYVFFQVEKEDPRAAAWKISAGTLFNVEDRSAAVLAEILWLPNPDFSVGVFARLFTASSSSTKEFGGTLRPAPGIALRPYRDVAGLSAEWHF